MKLSSILASLLLTAFSASAFAAADRSYYVTELAPPQKFDVYNDGRNTYLQSIPGLIVNGATADGEFYIVRGVPASIRGFMNGRPITVVRGTPPAPKPVQPDPAVVNAQIKQLTEKLSALSQKFEPANPSAPAIAAGASAVASATKPALAAAVQPIPAPAEKAWDIRLADKTIFSAMKRWSKTAGWQLMWDTEGNDFPVIAEATYKGEFDAAVGGVMASLQRSQFPLRACLYDNRAVRVIHKSKRCGG
jgi:hypothetical protein